MRMILWLPILIGLGLAGCERKEEAVDATAAEGRYRGIGVYASGPGWTRMGTSQPAGDSPAARLADDDHIIVVTDSRTGEVRQCGDLSGYCITLNPWTQSLDATRSAPVALQPQDEANSVSGPGQRRGER